jgi:hypothetical protein
MRLDRIVSVSVSVAVLAAAALAGCGGTTPSTATPASGPATMSVRLVDTSAASALVAASSSVKDATLSGYQEVNIDVQKVEIASSTGWIVLGTPDRVVNLLSLKGQGLTATLVDGATIPEGHYGQMRLILGTRNTVVLQDGTTHDLKVPSGQQTGIKLTVSFDVQPGTTADVYIDFCAHKSVFVHPAGKSGKYILRPTVRAYDRLATGSISGTLVGAVPGTGVEPVIVAATTVPLPGVVVTAQTIAGDVPTVVQQALTDERGRYTLRYLAVGGAYHVVSQPVVVPVTASATTVSYQALASAPIPITAAAPTVIFNYREPFRPAAATGGITATTAPVVAAAQDEVQARSMLLDEGGSLHAFVIRDPEAAAPPGPFDLPLLPVVSPATTYSVIARRATFDADGNPTPPVLEQTIIVPLTSAATTTIRFDFQ